MYDRISSLPEEIQSHILSFLPTKYAVGTSILSRRWKDLWTGLYKLDLDNRDGGWEKRANYEIRKRRDLEFCRFVDRVLRQHKDLNSLRRFRFHVAMDEDFPGDYQVWPNFLFEMGWRCDDSQLEEVDFTFDGYGIGGSSVHMRSVPESFYSLKHLKALKLEGVIIWTIHDPVLLPSVKILQLLRLDIKDCRSLSSLISGCPVLETLHIEKWDSIVTNDDGRLIAPSTCLKKLTFIGNRFAYEPLCLEIDAPNLEQLYLQDFAELQFLVISSPLAYLRSAWLHTHYSQTSKHDLISFLTKISNAKEMYLSWSILLRLSDAHDDVQLPVFPNLTHLTIISAGKSCTVYSLLSLASKLQSLVIDLRYGRRKMKREESAEPARTPECLLSSLEEIKIEHLKVNEDEMKMVAYLLEAGAVLKKVNMYVSDDADDDVNHDHLRSLLKLPRGSRACEAHLFLPNGYEII